MTAPQVRSALQDFAEKAQRRLAFFAPVMKTAPVIASALRDFVEVKLPD